MNPFKTFILLAALTALFGAVGLWLGGPVGMAAALAVAGAMNLFGYWNADRLVLRLYHAQPVDETHPDPMVRAYVADVTQMAGVAGLPRPLIAIIPSDQPNAFATGRTPRHAAVCATSGLLDRLERREIRAVMAHELAHVKTRDTLIMTVTAAVAGAIAVLVNFALAFGGGDRDRPGGVIGALALLLLAPMAAGLVQMAVSRAREYEADRLGAAIAGDPVALADALRKIDAHARRIHSPTAERNPASAPLFIINPLSGRGADSLFSTHPATADRVRALLALAESAPVLKGGRPARSDGKGPWG